ncbi:NIPSNAP family containing protein [Christiangramia fulva]|uniref:NIPSNAP family containing protein n=1 Tax=Christiangramia fulva TaxID=2126553 RepID=A0A2R3Z2U8_9FLAO|nr:NIPSNAP family protein [Christiangramia fulva]AVR44575.1 NIPSNAP family containing protein [Christiangramia fulva]
MISRGLLLICSFFIFLSSYAQDEVYELRIYHLKFGNSEKPLHDYFQNALIPALNRHGVKSVGAFEEASATLPKKLYLLIPYASAQDYANMPVELRKDEQYQAAAKAFWSISPEKFPYQRYETSVMKSTTGFPQLKTPSEDAQFFELRTYHGYNEDALRRKLKMFNQDEFAIFKNIDFPIVFFGRNIAGDHMPSLTYMLATKDKAENADRWQKFGSDADWKRISGMEEYANTVSNIIQTYLKPLDFSQL